MRPKPGKVLEALAQGVKVQMIGRDLARMTEPAESSPSEVAQAALCAEVTHIFEREPPKAPKAARFLLPREIARQRAGMHGLPRAPLVVRAAAM